MFRCLHWDFTAVGLFLAGVCGTSTQVQDSCRLHCAAGISDLLTQPLSHSESLLVSSLCPFTVSV